ncbi:hybrid sensor histidine kinase/response regulator [Butyrivibrio sp. INlla16]|uniref:hybrid sensor histidine kinase/response regulator n=1 Tax=Butyrivibrio sp. INlla16 TaxID=1520807 RepID=UPI00088BB936|nr:ATP-binding protein [Butyrivibrio sp. INlla16]SDB40751.1 Signal transduction histidine kinase [Butyrivibrio sp. INlla16]
MDRNKRNEEIRKSIQIVILLCYSLYSVGLALVSVLNKWEFWAVPIIFIGTVICWSLYVSGQFEYKFRIYVFAGFVALSTFFYGSHISEFYNSTLIIVLAMLLFSLTEEKPALRILFMMYVMLFAYHMILMATGMENFSDLSVSILILNILSVVLADRVGGYICEMFSISKKMADDLELELNDMKQKSEDFMANISHELRTPINVVTGLSGLMLEDEKEEKKKADLNAIQSAGKRLFSRIEDILDYTEIDTGSLLLSEEEYRISSIVNDIATEFRTFRSGTCEIVIDMDVNLPARMIGDAGRIKRIIRHLMVNAAKFTDKNGCVNLHLFARKKEYGANLCIEVTDTGIGMTDDERLRVIEGMYQIDSGRSRRAEGIGLGLSIVFGFVKQMGGFVRLESEVKKGTRVTVSIPQKVVDDKPSVILDHPEKLELACYLRNDKYKSPAVREYYNTMIMHTLKGLSVPIHRASEFEELKKLCAANQITHILIAEEEYQENKDFYENMKPDVSVIVSVSGGYRIPAGSKVTFIRKPIFSHSIVNAVNRKMTVWEFDPETSGKKLVFNGVNALVVDDEEMNLLVAKGILAGYGMDADVVLSGMEAVHLCEKKSYDVIFMDHMMPEVDGVEAMKMIRHNLGPDDHTAIIAFTANAVSGVREMFMKEGFDEFLAKPIEISELERILKKLLPSTMWEYVTVERDDEEVVQAEGGSGISRSSELVTLNAEQGVKICRGSSEFFEEVLLEFAREADAIAGQAQELYDARDWENYSIKLSGLKLSSRIIGADDLSRKAGEIERAAKDKWEAYIIANHEDLKRQIGAVKDDIIRVYGGNAS